MGTLPHEHAMDSIERFGRDVEIGMILSFALGQHRPAEVTAGLIVLIWTAVAAALSVWLATALGR